jgi:PadR family transcriptional regulator PadR
MWSDNDIIAKQLQIRKGLLGYMVLLSIEKTDSYAPGILENLKKANVIIVEWTLYPLLNRFKREGLLDYEWKESKSGPPRKYYRLTEKWSKTLEALHETWKDLVTTINFLTKASWKK